jgi:hypothetical protein
LRIGVNKYIYIDGTKTINFTIGPIPGPLISPDEAIRLVLTDPSSGWALDYGNEVALTDNGLINSYYSYSAAVSKGYYSIFITYDV